MNPQDEHPLVEDSDTRRYEKEVHAMVPELNRPFKLENAELTNSILKTTFEEFMILYPVEARFRQGYSESETLVNIPNFFVKIITDKLSKNHYLQTLHKADSVEVLRVGFNSPLYQRTYGDALDFSSFYDQGILNREELKRYSGYGLGALKASYQNVWLTKLAFLLNNTDKLFTTAFDLKPAEIIETIVRIRPSVIEQYNWFDFQSNVPKLLVDDSTKPYDAREAMRASLILMFLTLCDVDVVVLNDSHTATFENYIQDTYYNCFYPSPVPKSEQSAHKIEAAQFPLIAIGLIGLIILFILYRLFL